MRNVIEDVGLDVTYKKGGGTSESSSYATQSLINGNVSFRFQSIFWDHVLKIF